VVLVEDEMTMTIRNLVLLIVLAALPLAGAPKKSSAVAPSLVPHPIAMFLDQLCNNGKKQITFKASAVGTRFFFEEPSGVTVYRFVNGEYVKESFLAGSKLGSAMKRYPSR
jgi:hypothetical protein